jgi:large subunit ribosomal protein L5
MTRLEKIYKEEVVPKLMQQFGYTNPMEVPKLSKVTLNMGVGEAAANKKILENAVADMAKISARSRWSPSRASRWLVQDPRRLADRLQGHLAPRPHVRVPGPPDQHLAAARRDFRGVSGRSFDGRGNYNMGVKEQIIFPEIDFDQVDAMRGMDIAITTTAKTDAEAKALLEAFRFPFRN